MSSSSAGIANVGSSLGRIAHNTIEATRSDGFFTTQASHHLVFDGNRVVQSGSDALSVTSYVSDSGLCHDISIVNNTIVGNFQSRSITVNGALRVRVQNNFIDGGTSGISVGSAARWGTSPTQTVLIESNTLRNTTFTGEGTIGGGALHLYNDSGQPLKDITMRNNDIYLPSHHGIFVWGKDPIEANIQDNRIFADFSHAVFVNSNPGAGQVVESGNDRFSPTAYVGDRAPATGGHRTNLRLPIPAP